MKALILGDIHGEFAIAESLIGRVRKETPDITDIFHVGDFGFGWPKKPWMSRLTQIYHIWESVLKLDITFRGCLGNHDNYAFFASDHWRRLVSQNPSLMIQERGSVTEIDGKRILWCGGATSIDKDQRVVGLSWWPEESISQGDLDKSLAVTPPIDLLVTHEAAESYALRAKKESFTEGRSDRIAIQRIVEHFKPKHHVFGHWHEPEQGRIGECEWTCIPDVRTGHYAIWDGENMLRSWE